jgi:hypothetical protein
MRLKMNFVVIKEEDHARLLQAKQEVEARFEKAKWTEIARLVKEKGGESYMVCRLSPRHFLLESKLIRLDYRVKC